jgi:UDP-glucose 4-epimerase
MKKAVVTGAAGFLGRNTLKYLLDIGYCCSSMEFPNHRPNSLDRVLSISWSEREKQLADFQPDLCIHAAGSGSVPFSFQNPCLDFQSNTILVYEVLESLKRAAPNCKFILLSSAAVYGNPSCLPIAEDSPLRPISPYGFHKSQAEMICNQFSALYGMTAYVVRIFSAYGAGLNKQVVWEMASQVINRGEIVLKGTGHETRDFVHVNDVVRGLVQLAEHGPDGFGVYNLASGNQTSLLDVAEIFCSVNGKRLPIRCEGNQRVGDPIHWKADIGKMKSLGYLPQISLENGIAEILNSLN